MNEGEQQSHDQAAPQVAKLTQLTEIKNDAVSTLASTIDKVDNIAPERKFEIYLTAIKYTKSDQLLRGALEAAKQIQDPVVQSESLLDLIQELDYNINLIEAQLRK